MVNQLVEMICHLTGSEAEDHNLPPGLISSSLIEASDYTIYPCYLAAFKAGDSQLFQGQDETEHWAFFDTLCFEKAQHEPASMMVNKGNKVIGFSFVIPYGDRNRHISCMCVHPDYQRRGLGTYMIQHAKREAFSRGQKTISLWTETMMGAYKLYVRNGFKSVRVLSD
jgi:ribosomal protein S18 acetylase RimI-like enzyme